MPKEAMCAMITVPMCLTGADRATDRGHSRRVIPTVDVLPRAPLPGEIVIADRWVPLPGDRKRRPVRGPSNGR